MEAVLTICYYLVFTFLAYLEVFFNKCSTVVPSVQYWMALMHFLHDEIIMMKLYFITILKKGMFSWDSN